MATATVLYTGRRSRLSEWLDAGRGRRRRMRGVPDGLGAQGRGPTLLCPV